MTGFALTDQGAEWVAGLGELSRAEYIRDIGADRIARMWGFSFVVNAVLYTLSYLGFVFCMVLAIGGGKRKPENAVA
jgi:hypothetical protein